jgi:general secretion pathway protein D
VPLRTQHTLRLREREKRMTRRSELSANQMRFIVLVALAPLAPLSVAQSSIAAAPAASARAGSPADAAARQPLARADVDLLLRQARSAIQQGQLEQAESLLSRAESARIHYSLFYTGPTPTSVRRELKRAQRSQPAGSKSRGTAEFSDGSQTPADPFLSRNQAIEQAAAAAQAPIAQTSLSELSAESVPSRLPQLGSEASAHPGEPVANPFATSPAAEGTTTRPAGHPEVELAGTTTERAAAPISETGAKNSPWPLPNTSAPPALPSISIRTDATFGLTPRASNQVGAELRGAPSAQPPKQQALAHLQAARAALTSGDFELATKLSRAASEIGVPESQFLPDEDRPSLLAWDIERARRNGIRPQPAASSAPAVSRYEMPLGTPTNGQPAYPETQTQATMSDAAQNGAERWAALPDPLALPQESPAATNSPAALGDLGLAQQPAPPAFAQSTQQEPLNQASQLLESGEAALEQHDRDAARELFGQAHSLREQLSDADRERLQDRLQMLAAEPIDTTVAPRKTAEPSPQFVAQNFAAPSDAPMSTEELPVGSAAEEQVPPSSLLELTDENQKVLARQLSTEVGKRQSEAQRVRDEDPERALTILREAQQMVEQSKLPESTRRELLSRIDITLGKTQKYIDDNRAEIDLDERNEAVLNEVERRREAKLKIQQKTAELVDEFNRLRDEQRYAEMEIVSMRLMELAPEDPVTVQLRQQAKFIRRTMMNRELMDSKEGTAWAQLDAVERAAINPVAEDGKEMHFAKEWPDLVKDRKGTKDRTERRTERELEIERRLKTPVMLRYEETPLSEVMEGLSQLTGVNIHLDPRGLNQEGVNSDTPVTVALSKEISLKSALNLILEPLHLTYVVTDEVLKITSEQLRDGELITRPYNVADLVIPIPNFVPTNNIGLQGLINDAHAAMGYGNGLGPGGPAVLVGGRNNQNMGAGANDHVLAQQMNAAAPNGLSPTTVPIGSGPGGMGGGANADFDSLIDLIVSTVSSETWAENGGGEAEIRPFPTNLSLVISQTQAVHEEIADLLEQLRRLQDLQVTIEVRFIRLNDRFFERIGIDFDMNIEDRTIGTADLVPGTPYEPGRQSATVGLSLPPAAAFFPNYTADLDIPFRQPSFDLAVPPVFSGFGGQAATFGFAILSDIEAYFLIEAAQGDQRTNILNAPKVTLFNGQQAFVADSVAQPFVIGVIPVVGEFVAAQQPVIVVLNEGTMMTIQAVVSDDRRYVRLTVVPFFTEVGDVEEFTFEGSTSTTNSSSARDDDDDGKNEEEEESDEVVRSGVTVQLPAFQFVTVVTTVSVPDGGTVLLGGIKRLSEGRNEFGVPLLSKVPYINRLFRNVGIGRDTDSLMMMVTPRIIIQEEEEERLGIAVP